MDTLPDRARKAAFALEVFAESIADRETKANLVLLAEELHGFAGTAAVWDVGLTLDRPSWAGGEGERRYIEEA